MDDFYLPDAENTPILAGEEFKHCVKVLRKQKGDQIGIFDGKGLYYQSRISQISKDQCTLDLLERTVLPAKPFSTHLAIAPTKSTDRIEWMVEKLGELGVDEITFLQTDHSERPRIKLDRLERKAISAMKQSKSGYLMKIHPIVRFSEFLKSSSDVGSKYLAIVKEGIPSLRQYVSAGDSSIVMVGPEGDFSGTETQTAEEMGWELISLGRNTLRTETAGLIACHTINLVNDY